MANKKRSVKSLDALKSGVRSLIPIIISLITYEPVLNGIENWLDINIDSRLGYALVAPIVVVILKYLKQRLPETNVVRRAL